MGSRSGASDLATGRDVVTPASDSRSAAMRRRIPYVYSQVGWFLAACALLGAAIGTLYAGLKGAP